MFTLFDLFELIGMLGGLALGIAFGASRYGVIGGVLGGIVGFFAGWWCGRIPYLLGRLTAAIKPIQYWRDCLERREWAAYKIAIVELSRRGEDINRYRQVFVESLISENPLEREIGCTVLRAFYPDTASRIPDYDPSEPVDTCRKEAEILFSRRIAQ